MQQPQRPRSQHGEGDRAQRAGEHGDHRRHKQQLAAASAGSRPSDDDAGIIDRADRRHHRPRRRRCLVPPPVGRYADMTMRRSASERRTEHREQTADAGVLEHPELGIAAGELRHRRGGKLCLGDRFRPASSRMSDRKYAVGSDTVTAQCDRRREQRDDARQSVVSTLAMAQWPHGPASGIWPSCVSSSLAWLAAERPGTARPRDSADRATRHTGCATACSGCSASASTVGGVAIQRERRDTAAPRRASGRSTSRRTSRSVVPAHRRCPGRSPPSADRAVPARPPRPSAMSGERPRSIVQSASEGSRRISRIGVPSGHASMLPARIAATSAKRDPRAPDVRMCDERDRRPRVGRRCNPLGELRIVQRASREGKIDRAGRHGREARRRCRGWAAPSPAGGWTPRRRRRSAAWWRAPCRCRRCATARFLASVPVTPDGARPWPRLPAITARRCTEVGTQRGAWGMAYVCARRDGPRSVAPEF